MVDYSKRRGAVRRKLKQEGLDVLLVTDETNVTYLTGFTGDSSYLLLAKSASEDKLLSDSRYTTQIRDECADLKTHIRDASSTLLDSITRVCKSAKSKSVGFESNHVSKSLFDKLDAKVESELVGTEDWIESVRMIKDKTEIKKIRESIRVNQKAFSVIRAQLSGEQTEREIAHNLEHQIRRFGGSGCSFDPIVGVGPRSALPHGRPSYTRIEEHGFVLIDWGAKVDGYASDLTRVLVTAKIPPKIRKIYEVVLSAQLAAIAKIRPGVSFKAVDAVARRVIDKAGFGKKFGHGLGHGFGLQIHESPFMNPVREGEFQPNMVVTVEPGIYLPDVGGVRIEDDVLVTKDGCEVLSDLPNSLDANVVDI